MAMSGTSEHVERCIIDHIRAMRGNHMVLLRVEDGRIVDASEPFWWQPYESSSSYRRSDRAMDGGAFIGSREYPGRGQPPFAGPAAGAGTGEEAPDPRRFYVSKRDNGGHVGPYCVLCSRFAWDREEHEKTNKHVERVRNAAYDL